MRGRRVGVAAVTAFLCGASIIALGGVALAQPQGMSCKNVKGTMVLAFAPDGTGTGTMQGAIKGDLVLTQQMDNSNPAWGPRFLAQLVVTTKKGEVLHFGHQWVGANFNSQVVIGGGFMGGGRSGLEYYLSTSMVVGPNQGGQGEWNYSGQECVGQN